ncbi:MAG: hypothetical protein KDK97_15935 [Verrucomicrobiales bacterium]|nr:hypothetical protein [Verrucomicrobiales bacterium]MCP5558448.1 hypothetical protein [Verrucomicrobiaceae bacterium]
MPKMTCWTRNMMPASPELTSARNLAYQGVGRNLLQFQRLELLLKYLLGRHQGSYTIETMVDEMKRCEKAQERKTLGLLAGDLFEKVILRQTSGDVVPAEGADPGKFSHRFGITITEGLHQEWQSRLKDLVDERNQLVHLSLMSWDLDTIEGCQAVVVVLDEQRGRIAAELEQVKRFHEFFTQCMMQLHEELMVADVLKEQGASP